MSTSVNSTSSAQIPKMIFDNNAINKDLSISSQISSLHSTGITEQLPSNPEKKENIVTPFLNKKDLHEFNNQKQASKIAALLKPDVTVDMVTKALNFDGMANKEQQGMNYRPESSLIILTLLKPHEIGDGVLESAAKVVRAVQDFNQKKHVDYKSILKNSVEQLEKKIQDCLFGINGDSFSIMRERFKETYIKPEFENILKPHLLLNTIEQLSIDDCLLSEKNKQKQAEISVFHHSYQREGNTESVDKAYYIHSMFNILEGSLEIVKTLKTTVDWQERSSPSSLDIPPLQTADEPDGATVLPQAANFPYNHISGSYNTTNNYYFSSPLSENVTKISRQDAKVGETSPEESKPTKQSEDPEVGYKLLVGKNQSIVNLPRATLSQPIKESGVDDKLLEQDNSTYQSKGSIVTILDGVQLDGAQVATAKVSPKNQSAKQAAIQQLLPKNGYVLGSYLKNGEVPAKVTLSAEGALTRHQSDKDIYRGVREATKTVVNTASYLSKSDVPVTLTERGALTRDQSKKDAYTTSATSQ
ncbi:hypothetical protein [Providencia sp. Me31A]|uniref:hypothetical protein n=1 Tax=Providencia sp. Me31A TaxID=3392637 RepID=UPI003D2DF9C7